MPISSYAPEFLEFFRQAARKEITLPPMPITEAHKLRKRLHSLRRTMREENHEMAHIANGVVISLKNHGDNTATIIGRPADHQFLGYLAQAGISIIDSEEIKVMEDIPIIENSQHSGPENPCALEDSSDEKISNTLNDFFKGNNQEVNDD